MFAQKHRLAKDKDIQNTFAYGRSFFNSFFSVRFAKTTKLNSRFTVVVSTKVSKKATQRNRIKRIAREFIRTRIDQYPLGDYMVSVKPLAGNAEEKNILGKLEEVLKMVKSK